jgi:hypothetical protein
LLKTHIDPTTVKINMEDNYIWEDDLVLTDMLNLLNQQNDIGPFYIGNAYALTNSNVTPVSLGATVVVIVW